MYFKKLTDNPILSIGILFVIIFLTTSGGKLIQKYFPGYRQRLMPTSCRALMVKLNRRIPATWSANCDKNNLNVEISYIFPEVKDLNLDKVRAITYRELANAYTHIAKNSPTDNLEKTDIVSVRFESDYLKVNSISEGQFVVKLATLNREELVKQHFQATVKVQEVKKDKTPKK